MPEEEIISVEDEILNLDATLSALVDVLVKKGVITQKEFDDQLETYYE